MWKNNKNKKRNKKRNEKSMKEKHICVHNEQIHQYDHEIKVIIIHTNEVHQEKLQRRLHTY